MSEYGHDEAMLDLDQLNNATVDDQGYTDGECDRLTAYIERLENQCAAIDAAFHRSMRSFDEVVADRDRWEAKAEWLAMRCEILDGTAGRISIDWLKAADEAVDE